MHLDLQKLAIVGNMVQFTLVTKLWSSCITSKSTGCYRVQQNKLQNDLLRNTDDQFTDEKIKDATKSL